jgi:hypothetical protein
MVAVGQAKAAPVAPAGVPTPSRTRSAGTQRANQRMPQKSAIDRRIEILTKELNLNEVQRFDTRKILERGQTESQKLWADQQIAPIDRMIKLRAIREDSQKQFQALLTGEQRQKYQVYLQQQSVRGPSTSTPSGTAGQTNAPAQSSTVSH